MNWTEFLRTLTWFWAVAFGLLAFFAPLGGIYSFDDRRRSIIWFSISAASLVVATLLFSIIGGMNWGLTQQ